MVGESVHVWAAVALYALSTIGFAIAYIVRSPRLATLSGVLAGAGCVSQAISLGIRWVRVGHGPYLGFYEVGSLLAFVGVAAFLAVVLLRRSPMMSGVVVVPFSLLILGASVLASAEAQESSATLASMWLIVHVVFANLAAVCGFGATAVAARTLLTRSVEAASVEDGARARSADALQLRFAAGAFLFQGAMIASGAVWANRAWGAYWTWDPIEVWSLVAWSAYAVYLHLALTLGWRGRKAAWVAIAALAVTLFSLLGVPVLYDSIHAAYLAR